MVGEFRSSSADKWQSPCGFSTEGFSNLALRPTNQGNKFGNDAFNSSTYSGKGLLDTTFNSRATITWAHGSFVGGGQEDQSLVVSFANGETQRTTAKTRISGGDNLHPLMLFAIKDYAKDEMWNFSNFRLYGLTVKLNGTLKANLVPALNSEGAPGLYDTVHDVFLTNEGSGEFIYPKPGQWFRVTFTERWGRSAADGETADRGNADVGIHHGVHAVGTCGAARDGCRNPASVFRRSDDPACRS